MANIYYQLREMIEDKMGDVTDRRIWTFDSETDANEALEFFIRKGADPQHLYIDEVEK